MFPRTEAFSRLIAGRTTDEIRRLCLLGTDAQRAYWEAKYQRAQAFMASRRGIPSVLIEVAAQHPLVGGLRPGDEFAQALQLGQQLFEALRRDGKEVEIYVPGSRHQHHGVADQVSLSTAGRAFLVARGVPAESIQGDALNERYKGTQGVYCSADECFVAASHFRDGHFGTLVSVVSPVQLFRKTLHYIEFGVVPLNHTAPVALPFHRYIDEIFSALPYVLLADPSLQSPDSELARVFRAERAP
jgi:hypothetical protein